MKILQERRVGNEVWKYFSKMNASFATSQWRWISVRHFFFTFLCLASILWSKRPTLVVYASIFQWIQASSWWKKTQTRDQSHTSHFYVCFRTILSRQLLFTVWSLESLSVFIIVSFKEWNLSCGYRQQPISNFVSLALSPIARSQIKIDYPIREYYFSGLIKQLFSFKNIFFWRQQPWNGFDSMQGC